VLVLDPPHRLPELFDLLRRHEVGVRRGGTGKALERLDGTRLKGKQIRLEYARD
jgi:hypothetical protein